MAAWLSRVSAATWTRHLSEPRYQLVVLRELSARGLARPRRGVLVNIQLLDFLFPGDRPSMRARRDQPRLPDELFSIIASYYWAGGMWTEEEAAVAAEVAAAKAASDARIAAWRDEDAAARRGRRRRRGGRVLRIVEVCILEA